MQSLRPTLGLPATASRDKARTLAPTLSPAFAPASRLRKASSPASPRVLHARLVAPRAVSGSWEPGQKSGEGAWLVVGLGNPVPKYDGTRHNVGFEVLDALAETEGIPMKAFQCRGLVGKGLIQGTPTVLAKTQTFVNLCGESVVPLAKLYNIPLTRVLVVYEDLESDLASLSLLPEGEPGDHRGMRNITDRFGEEGFPRLKFGVGRPPAGMERREYVLQRFMVKEREQVDRAISRSVDGIRQLLGQGLEAGMGQLNQSQGQEQEQQEQVLQQ